MARHRFEFSLKSAVVILLFVLVGLYALFQFRFIILGPHIEIDSPLDGEVIESSTVTISGTAQNIVFISLNDRPIYIDEKGHFEEKLIVSPGLSIMSMKARDRFGRETERRVRIVHN